MKKWILSAMAAGALAVGGAASAQDIGSILGSIIAGAGAPHGTLVPGSIFYDQHNRQVMIDQYGRYVLVTPSTVYDGSGYDGSRAAAAAAVPVVPYGGYAYDNRIYRNQSRILDRDRDGIENRRDRDRDGDGIANRRDRYPDDTRYR